MAAPYTTRVRGLREFYVGCARISRTLPRELQRELRDLAEPVASTARGHAEAEGWGPKAAGGIRATASAKAAAGAGGASVVQRNRKTTGDHPNFGPLQMRKALLPAAAEHEDEIVEGVERMLDRLTSEEGFGRGGIL